MKSPIPEKHPMTAKRRAILEGAFAQLRISRAKIDPGILSKIRQIIAKSPEIMSKLGVGGNLKSKLDEDMPLSAKQPPSTQKNPRVEPKQPEVQKKQAAQKQQKNTSKVEEDYEKIDQAKTMEVMAKLMAINPDNKENIKSAIKKASD